MTKQRALGSPCWFELTTDDQTAAEALYAALFGWSAQRSPIDIGGFYTVFQLDGRDVAAAYALGEDRREQGIPPNWGVYFKADDADATATKSGATGGQMHQPPFEVDEQLRMAVCGDPEGAAFSIFQPRTRSGVAAIREPNAICWAELATRDVARAEAFHGGLFGWRMQDRPNAPTVNGNTEQVHPGRVRRSRVRSRFGLAPAESSACVLDDSALRASPYGPAAPFCLRQSRAAHPCAAATLTYAALPYLTFANDDGLLGGLLQMTKEWGDVPSHGSIYTQVEDVDATVAKAAAHGGSLCFPAFDAPGVGRIARIDDPSGAGFYIIRFAEG
jgi:predicted enzyme related to lactoylglutathione lyase